MPQWSDKSPEKISHEIHGSLCMPDGSDNLYRIIKKMTYKILNLVEKTSSSVRHLNSRPLSTKTVSQTTGAVFDDITMFPRQPSYLLHRYLGPVSQSI